MGLEARAHAHLDGKARGGILLLEDRELIFRGDDARRLRIPLATIRSLEVVRGELCVVHATGRARFAVPTPERWIERIRSPRSRLDKLGIARGTVVHLRGLDDPELRRELEERGAILRTKPTTSVDVVLFYAPNEASLVALDAIRHATSDAVAIWVVWTKGKKSLGEDHIRAAARSRDLVDVKVARVSDTLSGLKLVVRRERRTSDTAPVRRARPSARARALPPSSPPTVAAGHGGGNGTPSMPVDLSGALAAHAGAPARWDALPLSHRRRYLSWIEEAKRPATRKKRIDEAILRLVPPA